ncbi:hypothetical protein ABT381_34135, partial [Streptomyces sp. NPDC000151]
GPAAAAAIRRRALGDPDVGPPDAAPEAERWRPWRSYAYEYLRHTGAAHPEDHDPKDSINHAALHAA